MKRGDKKPSGCSQPKLVPQPLTASSLECCSVAPFLPYSDTLLMRDHLTSTYFQRLIFLVIQCKPRLVRAERQQTDGGCTLSEQVR